MCLEGREGFGSDNVVNVIIEMKSISVLSRLLFFNSPPRRALEGQLLGCSTKAKTTSSREPSLKQPR